MKKTIKLFSEYGIKSINIIHDVIFMLFYILINRIPKIPKTNNNSLVILGNGPSLIETLSKFIDEIKKHDSVCVNAFCKSKVYSQLQPVHYVLLDPEYWDINVHRDNKHLESVKETLENISMNTKWNMNLYIPYAAKKTAFFNSFTFPNNIKLINYNNFSLRSIFRFHFAKWNIGLIGGTNVLHACLNIAINAGYKKINIVGADHSWFENIILDYDKSYMNDSHFFDNGNTPKIYHKPAQLAQGLIYLGRTLLVYHDIYKYAKNRNIQIFNCSERSYIDAFQFRKLDEDEN